MSNGQRPDVGRPFSCPDAGRGPVSCRRLGCAVLALLLALLFTAGGRADDDEPRTPAEVRGYVRRCLQDLRSSKFDVREAARKGLERHGALALDLLQAARDDADPEVRRTVRLIMDAPGSALAPPPPPADDLQAIGRTTLEATGSAAQVLEKLGGPRGSRFVLPDDLPDRTLRVGVKDVPFFTALETIVRDAGLTAHQGFDASGSMKLRARAAGVDAPWAAAGALRVRVVEVTSVRSLTPPGGTRYVLTFDLHWVPSVQLVTYRSPTEIEARSETGEVFRAGSAMRGNTTYGVGSSSKTARLNLHLEPEKENGGERIAQLTFKLPVRLRHDLREETFKDATSLDLPVRRGDAQFVTLTRLAPPEEGLGPWVVDVVARLDGEASLDSLSILLVQADGRSRPAATGTRFPSADGTLALSARAYGRWEKPPAAVRVIWYRKQSEGELRFVLSDIPLR